MKERKDVDIRVKVTLDLDPKLPQMVRMANLCIVSGHTVNGLTKIHNEIVKNNFFNDIREK